jgi:hypothetical protein
MAASGLAWVPEGAIEENREGDVGENGGISNFTKEVYVVVTSGGGGKVSQT